MYKVSYPTNVMLELKIPVEQITDETKKNFEELINKGVLTEREQDIVLKYFKDDTNLQDIADGYGVTRERIRQIVEQAVERLFQHRDYILGIQQLNEEKRIILEQIEDYKNRLLKIKEFAKDINLDALEKQYQVDLYEDYKKAKLDTIYIVDIPNISNRAINCMYDNKIHTLGDLSRLKETDLENIRNLGKKTLTEIRQIAKDYDFKFA